MSHGAYYNEHDPFAASWLRQLISRGHIASGDVDERDIQLVQPDDLRGFVQCHFFAGIGGWSYALRLAGWADDRSVWTGSCPCQPISSAGQRKGHADERHLWPAFYRLIAECAPSVVFGEQVAGALGREWFSGVRADLESMGYACGGADLCAAGVGAPEIRQRLYWVANADESSQHGRPPSRQQQIRNGVRNGDAGLDLAGCVGREWGQGTGARGVGDGPNGGRTEGKHGPVGTEQGGAKWMGDAKGQRLQGEWSEYCPSGERHSGLAGLAMQAGVPEWNGPTVAILCSDGARRVSAQSNAFPLAHGVPARMGRLRAYGNAIVPQVAAEFISAWCEVTA